MDGRCLVDALVVDALPNGTIIVKREFVDVFRVKSYAEFGEYYVVTLDDLPEPLRSFIETRFVRRAEREASRALELGEKWRRARARYEKRRVAHASPVAAAGRGAEAGRGARRTSPLLILLKDE